MILIHSYLPGQLQCPRFLPFLVKHVRSCSEMCSQDNLLKTQTAVLSLNVADFPGFQTCL